MDPLDIIARLAEDYTGPAPTDAELESAASDIREALDVATTADEPDLDLAKDLSEALKVATQAITTRETERESRRAEAKALREGIFDDAPVESVTEEPVTEEPVAVTEVKEPVAAAGIIERLKRHAATKAPEGKTKVMGGIRAEGLNSASRFDIGDGTFADLGRMFNTHAKSVSSPGQEQRLFRLTRDYDETRKLGYNVETNNRRITEIFGFGGSSSRPQTAAGGLCGPGDVDFSHPVCSDRGRPIRDSLVQFNAARGTVTFSPAMSISDMDAAVSVWTSTTDAAPGTATKPCPALVCPEELTASIDAVVKCVTVGNFQAIFSPEFWAASLETLAAAHDREAEQKSLKEIHAASTFLAAGSLEPATNNVIQNFLMNVNSIVATDRAIQRRTTGLYHVITDAFVRDALRNQVIKNLGVANNVETIQIADGIIAGWLSEVGVRVTWTYDGTVNQSTGLHRVPAAVGAIPDATVYVHPEDAFMFLDGGTLDLGTQITDSSLNATNDRQAFAETFEKTTFRGCSAYAFTLDTVNACGC